MFTFNPRAYGPLVAPLLTPEPLCELGPGRPVVEKRKLLAALEPASLFDGAPVADLQMARCCLAGLWLLYDFLDESHNLSQEIHTPSGSYWHGIMHRREPDYSNAKYWFRRVPGHEVFEPLQLAARELALTKSPGKLAREARFLVEQAAWNPFRFVDLCETAQTGGPLADLCREIAQAEWRLLFDFCYRHSL